VRSALGAESRVGRILECATRAPHRSVFSGHLGEGTVDPGAGYAQATTTTTTGSPREIRRRRRSPRRSGSECVVQHKNAAGAEGRLCKHLGRFSSRRETRTAEPRGRLSRTLTFSNNAMRNVGSRVNILGTDNEHPSQQARRITIRNNLFTGVSRNSRSPPRAYRDGG
jgi:hypothetical protein